jgi:hypothetical protein
MTEQGVSDVDMHERDAKGRMNVRDMTDRGLLEEIAVSQRRTEDLVESFLKSMSTNPMFKMMAGKFGG